MGARRRASIAVLALAVGASSAVGLAARVVAASTVASAMDERASFGLRADEETVRALLMSGLDTGTGRWGIPMTAQEEAVLDLPGRMNFADLAARLVVERVRSLPNYGGAYFDQPSGGGLVVLQVGKSATGEEELASLLPAGPRGVTFLPANHSYADLERAADALPAIWEAAGESAPYAVSIDEKSNRIVAHISEETMASAASLAMMTEAELGVPVATIAGGPLDLLTCSSRENCVDPMRAGARIHQGSATGPACTMAFHVVGSTNDKQFVTAGHCGYEGSNNWYHPGLPAPDLIGAETATLYPGVLDMMRVQILNTQASSMVIGSAFDVTSERLPIQGEVICASLGMTSVVDCGTAGDNINYWDSYGFHLNGQGYNNISAQGGDSGSPFYVSTANGIIAFGTMAGEFPNGTTGAFAKIHNALAVWGWHLVTP